MAIAKLEELYRVEGGPPGKRFSKAIRRNRPRQHHDAADVGGSAIEASKIAGHSKVDTTLDYTIIGGKRHETLTRRIQDTCPRSILPCAPTYSRTIASCRIAVIPCART